MFLGCFYLATYTRFFQEWFTLLLAIFTVGFVSYTFIPLFKKRLQVKGPMITLRTDGIRFIQDYRTEVEVKWEQLIKWEHHSINEREVLQLHVGKMKHEVYLEGLDMKPGLIIQNVERLSKTTRFSAERESRARRT